MQRYSLSHLSDQALGRDLATLVARERAATADVVAHIAEFDARKLYLPAAYPSMFAYCVGELRLSEDAASKRIQAVRAARRCPAALAALAEGRVHLSGICLLAPHLTPENAAELLAAATHKTKAQIEQVVAERFPQPDLPSRVQAMSSPASVALRVEEHAPGHVESVPALPVAEALPVPAPAGPASESGAAAPQHAPGHVGDRSRIAPLAPQRYALQCTLDQAGHDLLRYAQELLSHRVPSGDVADVLLCVLKAAIPQLEKEKFAASEKPRAARRPAPGTRHVPAHVKRAVWKRDDGRCTFVGENGRRCESRHGIEFDHVQEVARGGDARASTIRLRCRAHNQYEAERTFGVEFMRQKRAVATEARAAAHRDQAGRAVAAPEHPR